MMLRRDGYSVSSAERRVTALRMLESEPFNMVITDIKLPDGDGLDVLRRAKEVSPGASVVVITAFGSTQTAVAALKLGASDYLTKPFDIEELRIVVRAAMEKRQLEEENLLLKAELRTRHGLDRILGISPAMTAVFDLVRSVAVTNSTVLVTGESGTGKELVAKAIHALSARRDAPFVSVNCGALPETLLESELFGHVRGAFTDAHQNRKGLFEAAHHGTLFLDEVGDMPQAMQIKLLRALQDRTIRRLGSTDEIEVDVRVVAATNRPPESLVRDGRLRKDLYYRLSVIPVHLPPLRERREDISILAEHFLASFNAEMKKNVTKISREAMQRLQEYAWPGNVRELENVIERAVALENTPVILPERLALPSKEPFLPGAHGEEPMEQQPSIAPSGDLTKGFSLPGFLKMSEAQLVRRALDQSDGDRATAAGLLGVSTRALRYLIKKYEFD
jgi:two-component system response regulator PilR (NtrC family)